MKFKISWPQGIIFSIAAFVVFILSFVYKVTFLPEYDHHLVSEDYYKDELNYQQEIDKLNNAALLENNVSIENVDTGLMIHFPSEFDKSKISGIISFKRLSNDKIDFQLPIKLDANSYHIPDEKLVEGRWDIKIEWDYLDKTYLFKKKIRY